MCSDLHLSYSDMSAPKEPKYVLFCPVCLETYADNRQKCLRDNALLRTRYMKQQIELKRTPGMGRFHDWLPLDEEIVSDAAVASLIEAIGHRDIASKNYILLNITGGGVKRLTMDHSLFQTAPEAYIEDVNDPLDGIIQKKSRTESWRQRTLNTSNICVYPTYMAFNHLSETAWRHAQHLVVNLLDLFREILFKKVGRLSNGYETLRSCSSSAQQESTQTLLTSGFIRLFKYILAVAKQIGEEAAWRILESCEIERRMEWLERNLSELEVKGTGVEKAYKTFLLKYLNLNSSEVPIVKKTEKKIVYRSYDFCPVLEACRALGLDTRRVCKLVYEAPTQRFLSRLNPKLKFKRNYERIRPYAGYCEEVIELEE